MVGSFNKLRLKITHSFVCDVVNVEHPDKHSGIKSEQRENEGKLPDDVDWQWYWETVKNQDIKLYMDIENITNKYITARIKLHWMSDRDYNSAPMFSYLAMQPEMVDTEGQWSKSTKVQIKRDDKGEYVECKFGDYSGYKNGIHKDYEFGKIYVSSFREITSRRAIDLLYEIDYEDEEEPTWVPPTDEPKEPTTYEEMIRAEEPNEEELLDEIEQELKARKK